MSLLESENIQLNEKCDRYLCALNQANKAGVISAKGAKVLASNSDPKNTNPDDNFFDDLYKPLNINRVTAKRSINSKGNNRGNISELLISNY